MMRTLGIVTGMAALAIAPVLAQEPPGQPSDTPAQEQTMPMMPGMMGSSGGMMQMMKMMNHCTSAMESMHFGNHGEMGMAHGGQRFDQAAAEGLARAYLAQDAYRSPWRSRRSPSIPGSTQWRTARVTTKER
jgi:hypothetical protein